MNLAQQLINGLDPRLGLRPDRDRLDRAARRGAPGELRPWPALHAGRLHRLGGDDQARRGLLRRRAGRGRGAGLLGSCCRSLMLRLMLEQNLTSLMIVTLGFGYVCQGAAALAFGGDPERFVSPLAEPEHPQSASSGSPAQDVLILAVTMLLFARCCGWCWSARGSGATVRTVAEDPKLAQLFGINPARSTSASSSSRRPPWRSAAAPGGAAQPDPHQHGLRRGDPDLRGRGAGRHRLGRRQPVRRVRPRPVHRVVRRASSPRPTPPRPPSSCCSPSWCCGRAGWRRDERSVASTCSLALLLAALADFFLPRSRAAAGRLQRLHDHRDLRGHGLRADLVLPYLGEVSLGAHHLLGRRRLCQRPCCRPRRLEAWPTAGGGHRRRRWCYRVVLGLADAAHARVRLLPGDLRGGRGGDGDRVQLGLPRRLRRHRRHPAPRPVPSGCWGLSARQRASSGPIAWSAAGRRCSSSTASVLAPRHQRADGPDESGSPRPSASTPGAVRLGVFVLRRRSRRWPAGSTPTSAPMSGRTCSRPTSWC